MLRVPLTIPPLWYETLPDETGFTMPEKITLRNAWTLIGPDQEYYAHELLLDFFSEHEELLDRFRGPNGEFRMRVMASHPYNIFKNLEAMIFEGLESLNHIHAVASPPAIKHLQVGIKLEDMKIMVDALASYLKKVLKRKLSPTLEMAIDKICHLIIESHSKP